MGVRLSFVLGIAAVCCASVSGAGAGGTAGASKGAWRALLEMSSASAWRGWAAPGLPAGWRVVNGVLQKQGEAGDLITNESFANFELELEWKLSKGGNSGLFYRGTHDYDHIYWSAPEYQLLDDANEPDGKDRKTAAASAYALYPARPGVVLPHDHWNKTRLVVNGAHVEHWLNGQKLVEYELLSADWRSRVAASKFAAFPHYGLAKQGFLGIQGDHEGRLAIRNIRFRELR